MAPTGEVVEVNTNLNDDPALVNSAAEGDGWMTKVKLSDTSNPNPNTPPSPPLPSPEPEPEP